MIKWIDRIGLAVVSVFCAVWFVPLGDIEGRYFPVTTQIALTAPEVMPPPEWRTRWHGTATKLRECDPVQLEWFLGPRGGRRVMVTAVFQDPPEVRDMGELEWDAVVISLDEQAVLTNSHADMLHDCGWPWLTRTAFYDPEISEGDQAYDD